jgi:release factor glutamine methyltransferase
MKIPSNKVSAIVAYFHNELREWYPKEEIESFIFLCFEQYLAFTRTDLVLKMNDTMNESDLLKFSFAVKALKAHVPVQYVLGNAYFYGLAFKVTNAVLIPRPETEELVQLIIKDCLLQAKQTGHPATPRILDIGTGSGCIAIALKANLPHADVHALDVSEKALEVARYNAEYLKAVINFIQADILTTAVYNSIPEPFDIIVSNPPYVKVSEKAEMHKNVLEHEPHLALFVADEDALLFYKAITAFAQVKLKQNGKLFFEINEALGEQVKHHLLTHNFTDVEIIKDINGKHRMVTALLNN